MCYYFQYFSCNIEVFLILQQFHIDINEDQFVFATRGTEECSDGETITDKSTCIKACMRLNVPLKEILGSYNCYKDGQGNCYQNGQNGGGASLICKTSATQEGKC